MTPPLHSVVYAHYRVCGRDLPWRKTRDPYAIFVSEVMLQQTQVESVVPKYEAFLKEFPNFERLARSSLARILKLWKGLGYNRRALYLKRAAEIIVREYGGRLPRDLDALMELPGIGRATAAAIAAYAFNQPAVFIETNIRRTFIHHFFPRRTDVSDAELVPLVEAMLDRRNPRRWYNALMDYGAMLARRVRNPNRRSRHYVRQPAFEGSDREIRGKILETLLKKSRGTKNAIMRVVGGKADRVERCLEALRREGILRYQQNFFTIA